MQALILAADGVEDCELLYPYYRLQEEGITVHVATPDAKPVTGKHGYAVDADLALADVDPNAYDALILPGGKAPETVRLDDTAIAAVRSMTEAGKPVACICHGAQILVSAGVLQGRRATCYKAVRDDVKAAGAEYTDEEVVVDDNLITSRFPDDLPAFMRELLKQVAAAGK